MEPRSQDSLLFRPDSYVDRLDLAKMFPAPQPLELEVGAGDGSFLIQWAKLNPSHNFLGVERLLGRIRKIDRKARRAGLTNIRLIRLEASYFLEYLMPRATVARMHLYFADPWPKRKHAANRMVNFHFTELVSRILQPRGEIFLRTDSADYFRQMLAAFAASPRFEKIETPVELAEVKTDFERGFNARGVPTLAVSYRLYE